MIKKIVLVAVWVAFLAVLSLADDFAYAKGGKTFKPYYNSIKIFIPSDNLSVKLGDDYHTKTILDFSSGAACDKIVVCGMSQYCAQPSVLNPTNKFKKTPGTNWAGQAYAAYDFPECLGENSFMSIEEVSDPAEQCFLWTDTNKNQDAECGSFDQCVSLRRFDGHLDLVTNCS